MELLLEEGFLSSDLPLYMHTSKQAKLILGLDVKKMQQFLGKKIKFI